MLIQIVPQSRQPRAALVVQPPRVAVASRAARVLDFDLENRPLSYLGSDFTTAEVTAIAWAWVGSSRVTVRLLGERPLRDILREFVREFERADLVTGHYITGHDLPMLNGALMECRLPTLPDKMVSDTKVHLVRTKGLSMSQESLGAMFRLDHAKVQMNQIKWRAANRLTPKGLAEVRKRVVGDVRQHMALREELLASGYLAAPKLWRGGSASVAPYSP